MEGMLDMWQVKILAANRPTSMFFNQLRYDNDNKVIRSLLSRNYTGCNVTNVSRIIY